MENKDVSIVLIEEAIQKGWKWIYLPNLNLEEVPELLKEVPNWEVIDLRGNKINSIPDWLNIDLDFETKINEGCPKLNYVYLHGNRFISKNGFITALIRSGKLDHGLFEMIKDQFESDIQRIPFSYEVEEDGMKTTIDGTDPNVWDESVVFQIGKSLIKLTQNLGKHEIQIEVVGANKTESDLFLSKIFEYVKSIDSNYGVILHTCPYRDCQLQCIERYIFDFKYLEGVALV